MERKQIADLTLDAIGTMSAPELIVWINQYVAAAGCPAEQVEFEFYQSGDHWDGYNEAELRIWRPKTDADKVREAGEYAAHLAQQKREQEEREIAQLRALSAKYGSPPPPLDELARKEG